MARYNVVDRQEAFALGYKTDGEYNHYALISKIGETVDGIVCWGFKRESLQLIADKRNEDLTKIRERMELTKAAPVDPTTNL